jgi:hypothetical protein
MEQMREQNTWRSTRRPGLTRDRGAYHARLPKFKDRRFFSRNHVMKKTGPVNFAIPIAH